MSVTTALSRREALKASILLPLAAGASVAAGSSHRPRACCERQDPGRLFHAHRQHPCDRRPDMPRPRRGHVPNRTGGILSGRLPGDGQSGTRRAGGRLRAASESHHLEHRLVRCGLPRFPDLGNDRAISDQVLSVEFTIFQERPSCRSSRMAATVLGRAFQCLPRTRRRRDYSKLFPSNATRSGKHCSR